jgi:hypothetical protein
MELLKKWLDVLYHLEDSKQHQRDDDKLSEIQKLGLSILRDKLNI